MFSDKETQAQLLQVTPGHTKSNTPGLRHDTEQLAVRCEKRLGPSARGSR